MLSIDPETYPRVRSGGEPTLQASSTSLVFDSIKYREAVAAHPDDRRAYSRIWLCGGLRGHIDGVLGEVTSDNLKWIFMSPQWSTRGGAHVIPHSCTQHNHWASQARIPEVRGRDTADERVSFLRQSYVGSWARRWALKRAKLTATHLCS